jgi:hypothetical protein
MPFSIQRTVVTGDSIEVIVADSAEIEVATRWIQVKVSQPVNQDWPLAVLLAIALRDARDEISAQIQAITQTHGPVPTPPAATSP